MNTRRLGMAMAAVLALAGCSTAPVSDAADAASHEVTEGGESGPLDGQFWRLSAADRGPLAALAHARTVTLGFGEGRAFGYAGCNRYFSGYTLRGNRLDLGTPGSTKRYCEGEGGEVERAFLPLLAHPFILQREGEHMRLIASDGTRLEFEAAAMESRYP